MQLRPFLHFTPLELLDHFLEKCRGQEEQVFKYHLRWDAILCC